MCKVAKTFSISKGSKYTVSVNKTGDNSQSTYDIEIINGKIHLKNAYKRSRSRYYCWYRILVILLLMGICGFTWFVVDKALSYNNLETIVLSKNTEKISANVSNTVNTVGEGNAASEISTDINSERTSYIYIIFLLLFIVIVAITFTVLVILLLKDDSGIRLAKLDELNSLRSEFQGFESSSVDTTTTVIPNTEPKSSASANSNEATATASFTVNGTSTTTTQKNNQADLLKQYMTCITEI